MLNFKLRNEIVLIEKESYKCVEILDFLFPFEFPFSSMRIEANFVSKQAVY